MIGIMYLWTGCKGKKRETITIGQEEKSIMHSELIEMDDEIGNDF